MTPSTAGVKASQPGFVPWRHGGNDLGVQVTMPDIEESFALMYSYQQAPGKPGCVGAQVMGPRDGYIAQGTSDLQAFWADRNKQRLGACLKPATARTHGKVPKEPLPEDVFDDIVEQGFQASETWHQGHVVDMPDGLTGHLPASVGSASWAFSVKPIYGWGGAGEMQRSTASWLAALPVFEPHWQVLMAHGTASGHLQWGDKRVDFQNCPVYAEKNWGVGFPRKWAWVQCNSFREDPHVSVTAVGAIRNLLNVPGVEEPVGAICVHVRGQFIELLPSNGAVRWEVDPWGRWRIEAKSDRYESVIEVECASQGAVLRAPLPGASLAPACKDSFDGNVRLQLWKLDSTGSRDGDAVVDATSSTAAVEVGGGPWWYTWKEAARMNPAVSLAVRAPVDDMLSGIGQLLPFKLPSRLLPPGY